MAQLDLFQKAIELSRAAQYDVFSPTEPSYDNFHFYSWIYPASSSGRTFPIFKVLMSNSCQNNCYYCANRAENHLPRYSFTPEELAHIFFELHRNTCHFIYQQIGLSRSYFSAFRPIVGTPMESEPPTSPKREHRLYQADFLIRKYHFKPDEMVFDDSGNLLRDEDPKATWAKQHPEFFPVELNTAEAKELIRVPGIGPKIASHLLARRRDTKIKTIDDLKSVGVPLKPTLPFILVDGRRFNF
jgi:predicted DNA-binding helix-hairpin-helix protein